MSHVEFLTACLNFSKSRRENHKIDAFQAAIAALEWQPMETAPKDGTPILIEFDDKADPFWEGCPDNLSDAELNEWYINNKPTRMTIYRAFCEGGSHHHGRGFCVAVWGGSFDDSTWEYPNQASMPDWWFDANSDFEIAVNPIRWKPVDANSRLIAGVE